MSSGGLGGCLLAVGDLTMPVQGFAPIYAASEGHEQADIATLMVLIQFGMIAVQLPLGALSDRIDRRLVLVAACAIVVSAGIAIRMSGAPLGWTILIFAIWCRATESIYAVSNAHGSDRAD